MPKLTHTEALDEYVDSIKDQYPDLTKEQIIDACRSYWLNVKEVMSKDEPQNIHIKHLGKLTVYNGRLHKLIQYNLISLARKLIHVDYFNQVNLKYQKILQRVVEADDIKRQRLRDNMVSRLIDKMHTNDFELIDDAEDNSEEDS